MKLTNRRNQMIAALAIAILPMATVKSNAQTELLAIEFNEDDQEGFDLWPSVLSGSTESIAEFTTDAAATSGTTTVTVTTSSGFGIPGNRGDIEDGTPEGFTYANLYQDLLHASGPTGFITLDFSGLNPNQDYQFTLYAWDPGATDGSDKEWTVTAGTGDPSVASVNFQAPLVDNESFALVFAITTTATGTFQLTNTNGLPQSAINGFKLASLAPTIPFTITAIVHSPEATPNPTVTLTWRKTGAASYAARYSIDMTKWDADLDDGIAVDRDENTEDSDHMTVTFTLDRGLDVEPIVFFRIEEG